MILEYDQDENYLVSGHHPKANEPKLYFHEFVLLLGRIALNCIHTEISLSSKLNEFFVEKLGFTTKPHKPHLVSTEIKEELEESDDGFVSEEDFPSDSEYEDPFKQFEILAKTKHDTLEKYSNQPDFEDILKELENLPEVPPIPKV